MKYYEILPTHTGTSRNTTRKIANLYIEFNYHFLTLPKKNPITLEQECTFKITTPLPGANELMRFLCYFLVTMGNDGLDMKYECSASPGVINNHGT